MKLACLSQPAPNPGLTAEENTCGGVRAVLLPLAQATCLTPPFCHKLSPPVEKQDYSCIHITP